MALPQQLKTARSTNSTQVSSIDNTIGELEQAIADILGVPVNTDITEVVTGRAKYAQVNDSNTVTNTTTETAFNKTYSIPANSLAAGSVIKITAFGKHSVTNSPAGSVTFKIRLGGTTIFQLTTPNANPATDTAWGASVVGIFRTIGASGAYRGGLSGGRVGVDYGSSWTPAQTLTIDTTAGITVDVTVQFSALSAVNAATMTGLVVEILPAGSTS